MKNAVVTGGTKGIGLAIVKDLLSKGYTVVTNYSSDDVRAKILVKELGEYGDCFHIVKADQADRNDMIRFTRFISTSFGEVNCIVCNTGSTIRKSAFEITDNEWARVFDISLNSHFFLIRDLHNIISCDARIIFIGSMMGIHPHATSLPYGISKAAVHALARNLVKEFEGTGTTVNAIAPGFVETEWQREKPQIIRESIYKKTAFGRFAFPSEIVSAVNFCLDNAFVNGTVIEVSGGYCYK